HIKNRIKAGKVILILGNIIKEHFGITIKTLYKIKEEVTIIIHVAANISFRAPL
ncbi:hypothetical protein BGZ57DRAFT_778286, partial [Hyaloscypha finlandica]